MMTTFDTGSHISVLKVPVFLDDAMNMTTIKARTLKELWPRKHATSRPASPFIKTKSAIDFGKYNQQEFGFESSTPYNQNEFSLFQKRNIT